MDAIQGNVVLIPDKLTLKSYIHAHNYFFGNTRTQNCGSIDYHWNVAYEPVRKLRSL